MEHVLVFVSILIGIAVGDMLISLHRLLRHRAAVRWDWLPLAIALLVLLTLVQMWWGSVGPDTGPITIGHFMPDLIGFVLLVLLAAAVLPDAVPETGLDLRDYYRDNATYIWSLFVAAVGWWTAAGIGQRVVAGQALGSVLAMRAGDIVVALLMVSLLVVRKRWWHAVMVAFFYIGPVVWMSRSMA